MLVSKSICLVLISSSSLSLSLSCALDSSWLLLPPEGNSLSFFFSFFSFYFFSREYNNESLTRNLISFFFPLICQCWFEESRKSEHWRLNHARFIRCISYCLDYIRNWLEKILLKFYFFYFTLFDILIFRFTETIVFLLNVFFRFRSYSIFYFPHVQLINETTSLYICGTDLQWKLHFKI